MEQRDASPTVCVLRPLPAPAPAPSCSDRSPGREVLSPAAPCGERGRRCSPLHRRCGRERYRGHPPSARRPHSTVHRPSERCPPGRSRSPASIVLTSSGGRPRPGGPGGPGARGGSVFRAVPASEVNYTQSFGLSSKIDQFLKRSDHSMDAWKKLTRRRSRGAATEPPTRLGRARSSAAIVMRSLYRGGQR